MQRQRRKRDRLAARGLTQCNVWVPPNAVAELLLQAELLRDHPHLIPGPLRDPISRQIRRVAPNAPRRRPGRR
jgi:hypothetical protein